MNSYVPHKFQAEFHKSASRIRVSMTGRQVGKSLKGTVEALYFADRKPGSKGRIIAPNYSPHLVDVNIPMVMDMIPQWAIQKWHAQEKRLTLYNNSEITFRSADDPNSLRGWTGHWCWFDEASYMDEQVYEVMLPGLARYRADIWITTTPNGTDWVYKRFVERAGRTVTVKDLLLEEPQDPIEVINRDGDPDITAFIYRTIDNPYIAPEVIEEAKATTNAMMFRQEWMASVESFRGLVYPDYKQSKHFIPEKELDGVMWFVGLDFGWNHPTGVVLMAEDIDHKLYVVDEEKQSHLMPKQVVDLVHTVLGRNGLRPDDIELFVYDTSARQTDQTSGVSLYDQMMDEDVVGKDRVLPLTMANKDVTSGIVRLTSLIRTNRFFVFDRCKQTDEELRAYRYPEKLESILGNNEVRPIKKFDDLVDPIRYVAQSRPDWFERPVKDVYGRVVVEEQMDFEGSSNLIDL